MENYNLLSLTHAKRDQDRKTVFSVDTDKSVEAANNVNSQEQILSINEAQYIVKPINFDDEIDNARINGKVVDALGTISDETLEKIYDKTIPEIKAATSPVIKYASTYKSHKAADVAKIKGIIYAIHHPEAPVPTTSGEPAPGVSGEPTPGTSGEPTPGASGEPTPGVSGEPTPGTSGEPTPGTSGEPTPGVSGEPTPGTSGEPTPETSGEPSPTPSGTGTGTSFITAKYNNFYNAETMFDYLSTLTGGQITKNTGITRAQLVKLTQNELAEEENHCFFGALNRIFYNKTSFNKDNNDVLSFEEIDNLFKTLGFGDELGEEPTAFLNKINQYCDEIQAEYERLTPQKRLEFVIDKARDYLEAAGLTRQIEALNRLISETDTYHTGSNVIKVGQIVMADCNDGTKAGVPKLTDEAIRSGAYAFVGGAYTSKGLQPYMFNGGTYITSHPKASDAIYKLSLYSSDKDSSGSDFGLTLDIRYVDENFQPVYTQANGGLTPWYDLVHVLVHELTHATAYQYSSSDSENMTASAMKYFNRSEVDNYHNLGLISDEDYNYYLNNIEKNVTIFDYQNEQEYMGVANRILNVFTCMWDEYAAYQADADYLDSIAGDEFNSNMTTAKKCESEKNAILEHIWQMYDQFGSTTSSDGRYTLTEAYPNGKLEDVIFTEKDRKNWTWA